MILKITQLLQTGLTHIKERLFPMDKFLVINERNLVSKDNDCIYYGFKSSNYFSTFASQEDAEAFASKKSSKNVDNSYIIYQAVSKVEAKLPDANITKL